MPHSHHTLTPRIVVSDLDGAVQFMRTVFGGGPGAGHHGVGGEL
jgi:hypothetical protein